MKYMYLNMFILFHHRSIIKENLWCLPPINNFLECKTVVSHFHNYVHVYLYDIDYDTFSKWKVRLWLGESCVYIIFKHDQRICPLFLKILTTISHILKSFGLYQQIIIGNNVCFKILLINTFSKCICFFFK